MKRKRLNQKGAAAVEFALVLPVLLILVFGIVELSVALYDKAVITNASREGARAGIVFGVPSVTDGEILDIVSTYCQNRLLTFGTPTQVTTTVVREGAGVSGDDLTVQVQYQYGFLVIPKFITGITGGIQLDAQTIMRME
jgi:Flp pilus assembly protein TadG